MKTQGHERVREAVEGVQPADVQAAAAKDSRLNLRVPEAVKRDMVAVAAGLGMNVTGYLTALHAFAAPRLKEASRRKGSA